MVVVVQVKLIFLKELNSFNFIATNELISYKVIFLLNKKRIKHSSVNLIKKKAKIENDFFFDRRYLMKVTLNYISIYIQLSCAGSDSPL